MIVSEQQIKSISAACQWNSDTFDQIYSVFLPATSVPVQLRMKVVIAVFQWAFKRFFEVFSNSLPVFSSPSQHSLSFQTEKHPHPLGLMLLFQIHLLLCSRSWTFFIASLNFDSKEPNRAEIHACTAQPEILPHMYIFFFAYCGGLALAGHQMPTKAALLLFSSAGQWREKRTKVLCDEVRTQRDH